MATAPGEADYGLDLSGVDDLDENMSEVSGVTVLRQALARRLSTRNGTLLDDPTYGYDIREDLSSALDRMRTVKIVAKVKSQILKDPRVLTCTVNAEVTGTPKAQKVRLTIGGESRQGPYELVVDASKVTVQLLTTGGAT